MQSRKTIPLLICRNKILEQGARTEGGDPEGGARMEADGTAAMSRRGIRWRDHREQSALACV